MDYFNIINIKIKFTKNIQNKIYLIIFIVCWLLCVRIILFYLNINVFLVYGVVSKRTTGLISPSEVVVGLYNSVLVGFVKV